MDNEKKSFIENAFSNGKYNLPCVFENISKTDFIAKVTSFSVIGYELPKTQTLENVWYFGLCFSDDTNIYFMSKCTGVGGWQELGSLHVVLLSDNEKNKLTQMEKIEIPKFQANDLFYLVYKNETVYAESGICMKNAEGQELVIVTAPAPGAVCVKLPDNNDEVKSEMDFSDYKLFRL